MVKTLSLIKSPPYYTYTSIYTTLSPMLNFLTFGFSNFTIRSFFVCLQSRQCSGQCLPYLLAEAQLPESVNRPKISVIVSNCLLPYFIICVFRPVCLWFWWPKMAPQNPKIFGFLPPQGSSDRTKILRLRVSPGFKNILYCEIKKI